MNQREYCELPLKRFGNWRARLKHEEPASAGKLLYRRGGGLKHMSKHMPRENSSAPSNYIPSARSGGPGKRRNFSAVDKRRIVEETCREGASVVRRVQSLPEATNVPFLPHLIRQRAQPP